VRESNQLDDAVVLDGQMRILANSWGAPRGTPCSIFVATPALVRHVYDTKKLAAESIRLLGEPYRRIYFPIMTGKDVRGVLCLDAHDPVPAGLTALKGSLWVGMGVSLAAALILGVVVIALMRFLDRTKREIFRVERLAAVGTLAASIAHEVKNPLGIILSSTQLLLRGEGFSDSRRELLRNIEEEVRRGSDQLDAFLDLARDMPLKLKKEDAREVISGTLDLLAARARQAGVTFESAHPDTPLTANIDRRKLRQALVNICLNAIEALAPTGGGSVIVNSSMEGIEPRLIKISVSDNGPGIPSELQPLVMEPFYSTREEGTGLGLPQARQIIERHGGTLALESKPSKGATITIRLPAAAEDSSDAHPDS
jgi:signal transduction histidine kinase